MTKIEKVAMNDLIKLYNYLEFLNMKIEMHYEEKDRLQNELYKIGCEIDEFNEMKEEVNNMIELKFFQLLNKNGEISKPNHIYQDNLLNEKMLRLLENFRKYSNF